MGNMLINKVYGRYASFFKSHKLKEADEYIKRVFPNAGVIRLDDGRYRYLTERECWRLQGYTDEDFEKYISLSEIEQETLDTIEEDMDELEMEM